jgi:hypothetical protein
LTLARCVATAVAVATVACGGSKSPMNPDPPTTTTTTSAVPTLTAPTLAAPSDDQQLDTVRPTLEITNATSNTSGTRTYEFQVADNQNFTLQGASSTYYIVVVTKTGVAEGGNGRTSFTVESDLQPTTRFYWRARAIQGATTGPWSNTGRFKTKLTGFNRAGELYDPLLTANETVGSVSGNITWVPGKGIRLNDQNAYVRYQLQQTITNGEYSVDVEGLKASTPYGKLKIFSMMDGGSNLFTSKWLFNVQYRGSDGNPDNCIAWKVLFGDEDLKLEPDIGNRSANVKSLDPARKYHWKGTWSNGFRLQIFEGGIGGNQIYDYGQNINATYGPSPHYAYLGSNNAPFGEETGSYPGATISNVWIGNKPRPLSLGSALRPE